MYQFLQYIINDLLKLLYYHFLIILCYFCAYHNTCGCKTFLGDEKKNTVLQAHGPPKSGQSVVETFFFFFVVISGSKNYPKSTEFFFFFCKNFLGKYSDLFSTFFWLKFNILVKKGLILQDFGKIQKYKKSSRTENTGQSGP